MSTAMDSTTFASPGMVSIQGAPAQQAMHILSGRSGQPIRVKVVPRSHLAVALAPAGDVDGDGIADYALSYKIWRQLIHRIEVLSGRDDRVIWSVDRPETTLFGHSIIGGLDVNGDGRPDLVAAAPRMTPYGSVLAFDHRGRLIHRLDGTAALLIGYKTTGVTVDAVGDVKGDGADDYVVGGRDHRTDPRGRGAAVLVSGRTGKPHWVATEKRTRSLIGDVVTGVGDINGDDVPDLVAASNNARNGTAAMYLFSGRDGSELRQWLDPSGFADLDGGIDADRDGVLDLFRRPHRLLGPGRFADFLLPPQRHSFAGAAQSGFGARFPARRFLGGLQPITGGSPTAPRCSSSAACTH